MSLRGHIALSLLVLLILQTAGPFLFFEGRRHLAKREMKRVLKARAPDEMLCTITLSSDPAAHDRMRVQWIDDKEFRLDGRMYDIVRSEQRSDSVVYTCIEDETETRLFAGLDALIRAHMNSDTKQNAAESRVQRLIAQPFLGTAVWDMPDLAYLGSVTSDRAARPPDWTPQPAAPPPKV